MPAPQELVPVSLQEQRWTQKEQWMFLVGMFGVLGIPIDGVGTPEREVLRGEITPFFPLRPSDTEEGIREIGRLLEGMLSALEAERTGIIRLYGEDENRGKLDILGYSVLKWQGTLEEYWESTRAERQLQRGSALAGLRMEKLASEAFKLGPTLEAARTDGEKVALMLQWQLWHRGANFKFNFDTETGISQVTLPVEKWDRLGLTLPKTGHRYVGCEFRPVVGGVRGMKKSEKVHGDIWFLGIPLEISGGVAVSA